MPPHSNSTSAEAVIAANEDFIAAGGLSLSDAMRIHAAIHDASHPASVTLSSGLPLDIFVSNNGARRCDVIVDPASRPRGRCKLMAQNVQKASAAAKRALAGAQITHILPLDAQGRHTNSPYSSDWGCIEEGALTKNCAAVLNQESVRSLHPDKAAAADKSKKRRRDEAEAAETAGPRTTLACPFSDKAEAKALGEHAPRVHAPAKSAQRHARLTRSAACSTQTPRPATPRFWQERNGTRRPRLGSSHRASTSRRSSAGYLLPLKRPPHSMSQRSWTEREVPKKNAKTKNQMHARHEIRARRSRLPIGPHALEMSPQQFELAEIL